MSQKITADYETQYLFPRSLEDWVGPEDPARYIREFVRQLPLDELKDEEELAAAKDSNGRPHYSFELLLSVWLYGYVKGIRTARKLERGCRELMPLIWLAGTHEPDHNTLWRFWNRYRSVLREVFTQSVKVAWEAKLIGMVMHAVDGTKIASAASRRSGWHREDLDRVLEAVGKRIDRLEKEIEGKADGGEIDDRLPEDLRKQTALRETIRAALEHLNEEKQNHLHPNDPDARMMVNGQGRTEFSYNAQAVADEKNGVIVAADVTTEANDSRQLAPMIDQVQENLGKNADSTVADSGYDTAEGLGHAERRGAPVIVHSKQRLENAGPYHTSRFTYDNERDDVVCPRGERLRAIGTTRHRNKPYPVQRYRCQVMTCPVRTDCSRDPKGRVVEISPHYGAVMRNRQRLAEPSSREALRKRGATIERIFAEIKHVMAFRRWTVSGKEKVQAQWWMICTAINLRRLIEA
jgi:transposase